MTATAQAMQAPVTGPHAATIRGAYLIAGALDGLDLTGAMAACCDGLLLNDTVRAQRRQDAAVLRVLLRAQRDLAHALGHTTNNGEG